MWKETVVAEFKIISRHLSEESEENQETTIGIAALWVQISNRDLENTKQEC
jgi:hypothetical protein